MSEPYSAFEENRIKHLEMIQAVVGRLANNSFVVKGWALTVAGAFFGIAVTRDDAQLALAGLIPVLMFFGLDVYFLQAERLFRVLYEQVRLGDAHVEPFFLGATSQGFRERMTAEGKDVSWQATSTRPTLLVYYGALLAAGTLIAFLL